jgi:hypothetical protein
VFFREKNAFAQTWHVRIAGTDVAVPQPGQNHPAPFPAAYSSNIFVGGFPYGERRVSFNAVGSGEDVKVERSTPRGRLTRAGLCPTGITASSPMRTSPGERPSRASRAGQSVLLLLPPAAVCHRRVRPARPMREVTHLTDLTYVVARPMPLTSPLQCRSVQKWRQMWRRLQIAPGG